MPARAPDPVNRIQRYRAAMKARGMRPIQIWVPETRTEHFQHEARRQCQAANAADCLDDTLDWIESVNAIDDPPAG